ncbi:hypothetical protein [Pseudomonas mandelii]|uniref:Uncharacterized protein n=1 Tax=Pseudomonas mandelii TaxID=75612 RepID=A0A502IGS0_9PSED|nr:hypothetical protein [Pseudomonas mandelii]TPG84796.1 hypothetical protein EAH74_12300 [Pseudomonas mandelii]
MFDGQGIEEWVKVAEIIARAGSETTGESTRLMLQGWGSHSVEHSAICWVLLSVLGVVDKSVFVEQFLRVSAQSSSNLSPREFIDFLCDAHIVGSENDLIYAHSYQMEGMVKFICGNLESATQGLSAASNFLLGSIEAKGFSSVASTYIGVIVTWLGFFKSTALFKGIITAVDDLLEHQCRCSNDFDFYVFASVSMGWEYGQSNFIRLLRVFNLCQMEQSSMAVFHCSEEYLNSVIADRVLVEYLIPRVIMEHLPFTSISYAYNARSFADLVFKFGVNLEGECRRALDIIYERMYVDCGDGVCDDPDLDINILPLRLLLRKYSSVPYVDKYTSRNTDSYNPYR